MQVGSGANTKLTARFRLRAGVACQSAALRLLVAFDAGSPWTACPTGEAPIFGTLVLTLGISLSAGLGRPIPESVGACPPSTIEFIAFRVLDASREISSILAHVDALTWLGRIAALARPGVAIFIILAGLPITLSIILGTTARTRTVLSSATLSEIIAERP